MTTRNIAGRQLSGRYTLLSRIAQGGMGEVWKARDRVTGNLVAAKVLRSELTGEEISLSRLRLEATNAMRAKHPNIAAVLDSGEDDHQGWIVMELVDGEPLTKYVGDGKGLTEAQLIPILIQTAYALDSAARAGVVHRDIKPANIVVRRDGKVKLTDFGVSFSDGQANLTAAGMVMGTAQYLPPEQALGKPATPVGDLYGLGVIAFEALAKQRPYTGKTQVDIAFAHVNEELPALPSSVSKPVASLVYRLLSKEPDQRPQTGAALARELTTIAAELGIGTDPVLLEEAEDEELASGASLKVVETVRERSRAGATQNGAAPFNAVRPPQDPPVAAPQKTPSPRLATETAPRLETRPGSETAWRSESVSSQGRWRPVASQAREVRPATDRTKSAMISDDSEPKSESQAGLWVIVGLFVFTVILIIFAMVRSSNEPTPPNSSAGTVAVSHYFQEDEQWLTPVPAA